MSRIYKVQVKDSQERSLVRAESKAGALRHIAEKTMEAEVATQDDLVKMVAAGVKVEDAGKETDQEAPEADKSEPAPPKKGKAWPQGKE